MTGTQGSYLQEVAKVELAQVAEIRRMRGECQERVAGVRKQAEQDLASVPLQLQEERRALMERTAEQAEVMAREVRNKARLDAVQLEQTLASLTGHIVEEVFHMMLPEYTGQKVRGTRHG